MGEDKPKNPLDVFWEQLGDKEKTNVRSYRSDRNNIQTKKTMQSQLDALVQTLANGGVDSMEEYKYIIGKVHAIDLINQELSNLLEPKEPNNDDNITRLRR